MEKKGSVGKIPHLYICGKGENKEDFEKLRDSLGLGEYIDIEGYIAHEVVASKFRSFDVSVLAVNSIAKVLVFQQLSQWHVVLL